MARYQSVRKNFVYQCFLAPGIELLHGYIPGTKKWRSELGYYVLTVKINGTIFSQSPPPTLSITNFTLIPLLYGFLMVFHHGSTEGTSLFSQNLTKFHIRSKSPHHSPLNLLILTIKALLLPYFSLTWGIKVAIIWKTPPNSTDKTRLCFF